MPPGSPIGCHDDPRAGDTMAWRRIEKVANGRFKRYVYDGEDILRNTTARQRAPGAVHPWPWYR